MLKVLFVKYFYGKKTLIFLVGLATFALNVQLYCNRLYRLFFLIVLLRLYTYSRSTTLRRIIYEIKFILSHIKNCCGKLSYKCFLPAIMNKMNEEFYLSINKWHIKKHFFKLKIQTLICNSLVYFWVSFFVFYCKYFFKCFWNSVTKGLVNDVVNNYFVCIR